MAVFEVVVQEIRTTKHVVEGNSLTDASTEALSLSLNFPEHDSAEFVVESIKVLAGGTLA